MAIIGASADGNRTSTIWQAVDGIPVASIVAIIPFIAIALPAARIAVAVVAIRSVIAVGCVLVPSAVAAVIVIIAAGARWLDHHIATTFRAVVGSIVVIISCAANHLATITTGQMTSHVTGALVPYGGSGVGTLVGVDARGDAQSEHEAGNC